jgi:hypothetical protein
MSAERNSGVTHKPSFMLQRRKLRHDNILTPHNADKYIHNSEHTDFSESTEEISALTKEEQKARLEELRKLAAEKRAKQAEVDREEARKNEVGSYYRDN